MNIGEAIQQNPGFLKLRKIQAAQKIAKTVSVLIAHSLWQNQITHCCEEFHSCGLIDSHKFTNHWSYNWTLVMAPGLAIIY